MRILKQALLLLGLLALLAGCDQQAMFEKLIPKEESAIAKQLLSRLAAKDYSTIEKQLDPSVQAPSVHDALEKMAAMFPTEEPKGVSAVGSNTFTVNGLTTYNLTFEHEYSHVWLLTNVVLQRRDDHVTVLGLHVNPMKQSIKELNHFTFKGKSAFHYLVFALVVVVPIFIVYTIVVCARTPIAKRKWLWLLFVAFGLIQLSFNWTDGSYHIQAINFSLLGAGFFQAGPYAPFIFNVSIPIGAFVFLSKRKLLVARNAG
jgi:hypothetical protein